MPACSFSLSSLKTRKAFKFGLFIAGLVLVFTALFLIARAVFLVIEAPELVGIKIIRLPYRLTYLMGEQLDLTGLQVTAAFSNKTKKVTKNYYIYSDTFTAGSASVKIISREDFSITASFEIEVLNTLVETGLPVIYIDTQGSVAISSKENYVKMNLSIVSDEPEYNIVKTGFNDEIRGRGNSSWLQPKKPYRIKFAKPTSVFGMVPARDWVLLANYTDPMLIKNTVAFEVGRRFNFPFTCHSVHVEVVLNGEYQGNYVLTEHMRVGDGRVDIDKNSGYLVELDSYYYDEEPKFETSGINLRVEIHHPDLGGTGYDSGYAFVRESLNEFSDVLSDPNFPNNNYMDILDIDNFVDFFLISEIVVDIEMLGPFQKFMYREGAGQKIKMGPLWDFDGAFGSDRSTMRLIDTDKRPILNAGWISAIRKLSNGECPVFTAKYKSRWNEKYNDILSILDFINIMQNKLRTSAQLNAKRWYGDVNFDDEVEKLKTWYLNRVTWLNIANR